ncbi:MAG: phosphoribosylanthranilate isomerase [Longimicrobiales bacterium]|nr:phosphoribosylanthranilate isomerase [Longimicrobiales bacterium]
MTPAVKICGLVRVQDGVAAAAAGADYLGLIASSGFPRTAPPGLGRELARSTGLPVVAVMVNESPEAVAALARSTAASVLQLHGDEAPEAVYSLRAEGPWKLWKAERVRTGAEVEAALTRWAGLVDGLLLDGWRAGDRGGTGARFPWSAVEERRDAIPSGLTFVAAGGLTPANVAEAVARLRPDVVDVSSGVESAPGRKDPALIEEFVRQVRQGRTAGS